LLNFGVQNRSWGCPSKVPKTRSAKKRATPGNNHAKGSKMGPRNRKVGGIFDDFVKAFPEYFVGWVFNVFWDGFWIGFCKLLMLYLDIFM
jgi:hypothetical protein